MYTKIDRLKKKEREANIEKIRERILKTWDVLPQEFMTSGKKHLGRHEILDFIGEVNERF